MEIVSNALSEMNSQALVKIIKVTVDERSGNSTKCHASDLLEEHTPVHLNNGLYYTSLNSRDINGEEGSKNQEDSQESYIVTFTDVPGWE